MITLALAVGVRGLVRRGAVVKRLSAVETLGSTDVICTDKTGTLTENRMRVTASGPPRRRSSSTGRRPAPPPRPARPLAAAMAACNNAQLGDAGDAAATRPRSRCSGRRELGADWTPERERAAAAIPLRPGRSS